MQRSLRALLLLLFLGLLARAAYSQGTVFNYYRYTFTGDTSPLNISVVFTAPRDIVETGLISTGQWGSVSNFNPNVLGGYMQMGDSRVPITSMYFPVLPGRGDPVSRAQYLLAVDGLFGVRFPGDDWVEITGGTYWYSVDDHSPEGAHIYRDTYPGDPQYYNSGGMWHVTIVPEPSSVALSLLLLAITVWQARRLPQRACR